MVAATLLLFALSTLTADELSLFVVNRAGPREYRLLAHGWPFKMLYIEVESPEGSSNHAILDPYAVTLNLAFWALITIALYRLQEYYRARRFKNKLATAEQTLQSSRH